MKVLMLEDGPHQVNAPAVPQNIALQKLGYRVPEQFGGALFIAGSEREIPDPDEPGEVLTVKDFDLQAFADHIAVLLDASEPQAWDAEKVAAVMDINHIKDYYDVLTALADEGFGEDESPLATP